MAIKIPYVIGIDTIKKVIPDLIIQIVGDSSITVDRVSSVSEMMDGVLVFCSKPGIDVKKTVASYRKCIVLVGPDVEISQDQNLWVKVNNPRLAFCKLAAKPQGKSTIHSSAVISPDANIGERVEVGALSYIGNVQIGNDVVIGKNVIIEDGVKIGNRVTIKSGSIIGSSGFGFEKDSLGIYHEFYHWGGVEIEDDVQIGANCCVDRGALGNTVIKSGVKTDNFVHIAHNCVIGKNSILTAMTELSGSVKVGEGVWFAPCSSVINGVNIGDNAFLGIGSICTTNMESGHRLIPAFSSIKPPKK